MLIPLRAMQFRRGTSTGVYLVRDEVDQHAGSLEGCCSRYHRAGVTVDGDVPVGACITSTARKLSERTVFCEFDASIEKR